MGGRIELDQTGVIVAVDDAVAGLLRTSPDALIGIPALDRIAPADHDNSYALFQVVLGERRTATTVKRLIRADGTFLWARGTVSYSPAAGAPRCVVEIEPTTEPDGAVEPNKLLRIAEFQQDALAARRRLFGDRLFMDSAWDILLAVYVEEARGRVFDAPALFDRLGLVGAGPARWLRALRAEGLLACDDENGDPATCPFRLSPAGYHRLETYLATLYSTLTPADRMNMPA